MSGHLYLEITEKSPPDIVYNRSFVTAVLYIYGNGQSWNYDPCPGTITIDGTSFSFSHSFTKSTGAQYLGEAGKWVTHNSNGNYTVGVSARFATDTSALGTMTTSTSKVLSTIPRVSDLSVNKASIPADGETTIIATATKKSSSFTDTLSVSLGSYSKSISSGVAFTIPTEWVNAIPGTSGIATVRVTTKSGSTTVGSAAKTFEVTVPANVVPVINDVTISEAVAAVSTAFGRYVQTLSQINAVVDASGVYGSAIRSYSVALDGVTYIQQAFTSNVISGYGDLPMVVTITDSRNRTATTTVTVPVVEYSPPVITAFTYKQCNSDGTPNNSGACTKLTIAGSVASVEEQNSHALTVKYKKTSDQEFVSVPVDIPAWEFAVETIITNTSSDETYEFLAILNDKVRSTESAATTGKVVISRLAGGNGVTLFAEAEQPGFWVGNIDYTISDAEYSELAALLGISEGG